MDIASLSTALAQVNTTNDVGVAMLSKSLDVNEQQGDAMIKMMNRSAMELSVNPGIGGNFDIRV